MSHSVLIVDDDPAIRRLLREVLASEGYSTVEAENGAQAVRRLVEMKPSVIVLDVEMPVMDGHDFREVQKRIAPDVPIVCISGTAHPEWAARLVGAVRCHAKPLDFEQLCGTVAELCESVDHGGDRHDQEAAMVVTKTG
jgi:two-component system response regulator (stage 0 sporulation protein F)